MTDTDTKKTFVGLLFAFLATMCWASNYPVNRLIFNAAGNVELDELWASWIKFFLGAVVLLPISITAKNGSWGMFRKEWKQDWKMFLFLCVCIVCEGVLCFISLKYTTSARSSLMANTSPVFTLLFSVLAAKEMLNKRKVIGILLGLAGIILAATSKGGDMFSAGISMIWGDLLALSSGIFWALFTVFGGVVASRYNGVFCTTFYRIGGLLLLLPLLWIADSNITLNLPFAVWCGLFYTSIFSGGIAVWLWSIAQKHIEPGILGTFGYMSAFCATAFSLIFLREKLTWNFVLAFIFIIVGMTLVIKRQKASDADEAH
jgi:drug/metabolite transporter (DMT)-like permease